jgi:Na+/melibiose symporter-like transporter
MHVFTYTFQLTNLEIPLVMLSLIGGIVLAQPLWFHVSKKTDKPNVLIAALILLIASMFLFASILIFRTSINPTILMALICFTIFLSGAGTGALYSLPISMFADCIHKEQEKTGVDRTAISAGFLTLCTKFSKTRSLWLLLASFSTLWVSAEAPPFNQFPLKIGSGGCSSSASLPPPPSPS